MKHVGGVNVLQSAENLVDERLEMSVGQVLSGTDNGGEITLHQLCLSLLLILLLSSGIQHTFGDINLIEVPRRGYIHRLQVRNIAVSTEMLQQLNLSQRSLSEDLFAEHIRNFFNGDFRTLAWDVLCWVVWEVRVDVVL